ncbi:MAG: MerR family transcriptional regulator [Lachnospiraceae bacterium]|nr:MerR family transcriptional regulator [Lachnospiraceae bacterium]
MTIKEVCEKYDITPDTLRYYERVGVIPEVSRTAGGIRNYTQTDLNWVENAICMRGAGVPVEMIIEYVRLFQMGDATFEARCNLLKEARETVEIAKRKYDQELNRLNYKIGKYEEAIRTGVLIWDDEEMKQDCLGGETK